MVAPIPRRVSILRDGEYDAHLARAGEFFAGMSDHALRVAIDTITDCEHGPLAALGLATLAQMRDMESEPTRQPITSENITDALTSPPPVDDGNPFGNGKDD